MLYLDKLIERVSLALVHFRRYNSEVMFTGFYLWCAIALFLPSDILTGSLRTILEFGDISDGKVACTAYFIIFAVKLYALVYNNVEVRKWFLAFTTGFMSLLVVQTLLYIGFTFVVGLFALLGLTAALTLWRFSANATPS